MKWIVFKAPQRFYRTCCGILLFVALSLPAQSSSETEIDLGSRPYKLVGAMDESPLKQQLLNCKGKPVKRTDFSIGHRGAPLHYPEHTRESYEAAARMGAGILECDVTFTVDGELVCRHAQCDLHTTTNIIATELNQKCSVPWDHKKPNPNSVKCCASDITLEEFKTLQGKMDFANHNATSTKEYLDNSSNWRTNFLQTSPDSSNDAYGTLMTHAESIELFRSLGVKYTPELKGPDRSAARQVEAVFGSQQAYAQKMISEYRAANVLPEHLWPQSFNIDDVLYWIETEPKYGRNAIYLDDRYLSGLDPQEAGSFKPGMQALVDMGINVIAPPLWMLLTVNDDGQIVPSAYAKDAKKAGLDIIAWSFERSDLRKGSRLGTDENAEPILAWYYQFDNNSLVQTITTESDMYKVLHVLAKDVEIMGIFSDWPATTSFYANCMGIGNSN